MKSTEDIRICTLLPSATEIAYRLGLGPNVVGVTHECDYPADVQHKRRVVHSRINANMDSGQIDAQVRSILASGESVYELDLEAMSDLAPDLVITQGLCEVCALPYDEVATLVKQLAREPEIVDLNPTCLDDVLSDIVRVGEAAGVADMARLQVSELRQRIEAVRLRAECLPVRKVVCLEWLDPLMIGGHWIPEMVELAGGEDALGHPGQPTRRVSLAEVVDAGPGVILLMPCGFDVATTVDEAVNSDAVSQLAQTAAGRNGEVYAVNANAYFSRSGPRLVDGLELLAAVIHPELGDAYAPDAAVKLGTAC